jgi:hypothetical protein
MKPQHEQTNHPMSQQIQIKNGRAYPVIVCDHCGKRILDAKDGNTVWRESFRSRETNRFIPIHHTHKGCNWFFMNRRFPEPPDNSWCWMSHDLPHDLFMLLLNVEFNQAAAKRQAHLMAML